MDRMGREWLRWSRSNDMRVGEQQGLARCMGFWSVCADLYFHSAASPFHFFQTQMRQRRPHRNGYQFVHLCHKAFGISEPAAFAHLDEISKFEANCGVLYQALVAACPAPFLLAPAAALGRRPRSQMQLQCCGLVAAFLLGVPCPVCTRQHLPPQQG